MGLRSHAPEGCNDCQEYEKKMTETKTFKNPNFVSGYSYGNPAPYWEVHDLKQSDSISGEMSRDEWDMEVTFTKKTPHSRLELL